MRKLFILLAVVAASATVASAQDWSVGGRIGSGFQGIVQRNLSGDNYVEGRLGMSWINGGGIVADVSALYVWNIANMNLTDSGNWFFDLGAGLNLGGRSHFAYFGVQGMAKFGYAFDNSPLKIAIDWSPSFGPGIGYGGGHSVSDFHDNGIANFGLSVVYSF